MLMKRFEKILNLMFSFEKCWYNSSWEMLVEIFMKNVGLTFSLKIVATLFWKISITFFKHIYEKCWQTSKNVDEKM
jgi:hypothetical protein